MLCWRCSRGDDRAFVFSRLDVLWPSMLGYRGSYPRRHPALVALVLCFVRLFCQPYRAPRGTKPAEDGIGSLCNDRGEWNVFYLFLHNVDFREVRSSLVESFSFLLVETGGPAGACLYVQGRVCPGLGCFRRKLGLTE